MCMKEAQAVFEYLSRHYRISSLPAYDDFRDLLERPDSHGPNERVQLIIPAQARARTNSLSRQVSAFLWGREVNQEQLRALEVRTAELIPYADNEPVRVEVASDVLEPRAFYAKPFGEQRMFGLELEHLVSRPYNFVVSGSGIFEEEVPGIEGVTMEKADERLDEAYVRECARFEARCQALLFGDMHEYNWLVEQRRRPDSSEVRYEIRTIDPDKLFELDELKYVVFSRERRQEMIGVIGEDAYEAEAAFERKRMRNSFLDNRERVDEVLRLVGNSEICNAVVKRYDLAQKLAIYHRNEDFYNAENAGELLERHLHEELEL